MLIVLLACTTNTAQIYPIDSSKVLITSAEFKHIIKTSIELESCRKVNTSLISEVGILYRSIDDKNTLIELKDRMIENLREQLDIKPAWYNKFGYGFAAAVIVVTAILFLVK